MVPPPTSTDTRDRILEAGARAISAKSYNGCGLNEILGAAGVPKGSFYHYFSSKEDFVIALIERERDSYLAEMRPLLQDRKKTPMERLRTVFEMGRNECLEQGPERRCLVPKLALETGQLSEPVQAAVRCAYQQWTALLAQVVREAQAAEELSRDEDPERIARVLVMLWEGATIRMQIDRSLHPLQDFFDFVFTSRLLARPPAPPRD